ncbi:hypothetical protein HU200_025053 [Digitaria exilis]|uniref:Uncharacterized protein n=1 Tax=Digitaria exilis TaxID=1010633 RepID=A0A835B8Y4_9POAL|nr:hypothetical protein HU200_044608 [Digitaria exilis]KAF8718751.1 hypothetical protein HU200_025053 [Digitaria exilis]
MSNEISTDTVCRTLRAYVDIFVITAEDSYNRRFTRDNVLWFLDALRGLGSISHILLENALETLSQTHPRESLSEYAFNVDVKNIHREFNWQIDDLEYVIWNRCRYELILQLVLPTFLKGVKVTRSFLRLMVARRQRVLSKASSKELE